MAEQRLFTQRPADSRERAIIAGLVLAKYTRATVEEHLEELSLLAETAGANVIDTFVQERDTPDSAHYFGKGKAAEIAEFIATNEITLAVIDDELSPAQTRNLQKLFNCKVLDRTALILDIFATRARTSTAKTQVELAQLEYLLPRLTRMWTHLEKQSGGIGTRGPGETQIETDRRMVRTRISSLKEKLRTLEKQKTTQRAQRSEMFLRIALIGYTNAGKSSLLNVLTGAETYVEDQLFATLDTTSRKLLLPPNTSVILSDTIGFIRKLPPQLVASFESTLAEITDADYLLHIVDASSPNFREHLETVHETIVTLGAEKIPTLLVFNKIDACEEKGVAVQLQHEFPSSIVISALRHINITALNTRVKAMVESSYIEEQFILPPLAFDVVSAIHEHTVVLSREFTHDAIILNVSVLPTSVERLRKLVAQAFLDRSGASSSV